MSLRGFDAFSARVADSPRGFTLAPGDEEPAWFVVHTRPRCEKKFAALVAREKFVYDLPLITSLRHYRTQTKRFLKPLFPGYVFAQVESARRSRLFQQDLVVRLLPVPDQDSLLHQLDAIRRMIAAGFALHVMPLLKKGRAVRVVGGPLHGLEGMVHDPDHPQGIVIAVDVLQKGVLIRLPLENLQVLP
jgi:transcriptional antiterminator RfaH